MFEEVGDDFIYQDWHPRWLRYTWCFHLWRRGLRKSEKKICEHQRFSSAFSPCTLEFSNVTESPRNTSADRPCQAAVLKHAEETPGLQPAFSPAEGHDLNKVQPKHAEWPPQPPGWMSIIGYFGCLGRGEEAAVWRKRGSGGCGSRCREWERRWTVHKGTQGHNIDHEYSSCSAKIGEAERRSEISI